jgi:hypothetical protein
VRGNTEVIAQMIQELAGGDMVSLKMKDAYPDSYDEVVSMEKEEQRKQTHVPITTKTDVSGYEEYFHRLSDVVVRCAHGGEYMARRRRSFRQERVCVLHERRQRSAPDNQHHSEGGTEGSCF